MSNRLFTLDDTINNLRARLRRYEETDSTRLPYPEGFQTSGMIAFKRAVQEHGIREKIQHIKAVRANVSGMGLAEAKAFVEYEPNRIAAGAQYGY